MNLVTLERLSWLPAGRPIKAHRAGEMLVGIWKMEMRAGLASSPSTGALRRRRLSASFCTLAAFFSSFLASVISTDTVSRTARRAAVIDLASISRRGSSAATTPSVVATGVATTGVATTGVATTGAAAAFLVLVATATGAATTGAATTVSGAAVFLATLVVLEAVAELIILGTEEEEEDILRRTY